MSSIDTKILSMGHAEENLLDVGQGIKLWYRTWGNYSKGSMKKVVEFHCVWNEI